MCVYKLNRTELAGLMGKNVTTIDSWIRDGMPFLKKGSKGINWEFDLTEVIKWREQKIRSNIPNSELIEYEEARRRKVAAEAGILEIELQRKRSEVISKDEVEQGLSKAFLTIKQRLRTIPERIISQLISETDERQASELMLNEIDDALLELSQQDYNAILTESDEETSSSSTETNDI